MTAFPERPRLGVVSTHPIQYQVPLLRALAARPEIELKVGYLTLPDAVQQGAGFGVAFHWDVPLLDGYTWRVLPTAPLLPGRRFTQRWLRRGAHTIREWGIDVMLATGWQSLPQIQAIRSAARQRIPVLVRGDSNWRKARGPLVRTFHRNLFASIGHFLAVGADNRRFYRDNGIPEARIVDAPHFVDNRWFQERAARLRGERASLRAAFGVPEGATCFLFAGKFERKKHPSHVLAAIHHLWSANHAVHLLMVGAGALESELRAAAASERLPVSFAGFLNQSNMPQAYVAADALVLPSDSGETWGLVVNEAMACRLPAITSDQAGCAVDLVLEGETGYTYPFADVEALTSCMRRMTLDSVGRAEMGVAAERRVTEQYSVERTAEAVVRAVGAACSA